MPVQPGAAFCWVTTTVSPKLTRPTTEAVVEGEARRLTEVAVTCARGPVTGPTGGRAGAVAAGEAVVAPSATRRLLEHVVPRLPDTPGREDPRLDVLTDREREVLVEIAKGATNAEIASNLFMAEGTVKTHVGRLLSKLGARDRVNLVLIAFETGLVD